MGLTTERRQKKESVNLKLEQQKSPCLIKKEKINRKEEGGGGGEKEKKKNNNNNHLRDLGN